MVVKKHSLVLMGVGAHNRSMPSDRSAATRADRGATRGATPGPESVATGQAIDWRLGAALVGVVLLWSSAFIGIRAVGDTFSPGPFALGRMVLGTAVFALVVVHRGSGWRLPRRGLALSIVFGVLWFGGYTVALNAAGQRLDAGTAAMLVNIGPLLVALGAGLFLGEGFPRRLMVGSAVAFVGIVVIGTGGLGEHSTVLGFFLGVLSAAAFATGVLIQKITLRTVDAATATAVGCAASVLALSPFAPQLIHEVSAASTGAILGLIYLGIFPTGIGFVLWGYALTRASAGQTASTTLAVPAVTVAMSAVLLAEWPTLAAMIGGTMALIGVAIGRSRPARRRRRTSARSGGSGQPEPDRAVALDTAHDATGSR